MLRLEYVKGVTCRSLAVRLPLESNSLVTWNRALVAVSESLGDSLGWQGPIH